MPIGAAACGGNSFKESARASGERPIGATSCRQQYNHARTPPSLAFRPPATVGFGGAVHIIDGGGDPPIPLYLRPTLHTTVFSKATFFF